MQLQPHWLRTTSQSIFLFQCLMGKSKKHQKSTPVTTRGSHRKGHCHKKHKKSSPVTTRGSHRKSQRRLQLQRRHAPHQIHGSSSSSDSSSYEYTDSSSTSGSEIRAHGSFPLMRLPQSRLQGIVQAMAPTLCPVTTSPWSTEDFCRMIWILARVRPDANVSSFKANTYRNLERNFVTRTQNVAGRVGRKAMEGNISSALIQLN